MGLLRVVAGRWRGRRIQAGPDGDSRTLRPTADRVRTSLFDRLTPRLPGARVLDLCAGTGALGIEALSRGAAHVTFVDASGRAQELLKTNLAALEVEAGEYTLRRDDALRSLVALDRLGERFDLLLADPPYDSRLAGRLVEALGGLTLLEPEGWIVVEHDRREELPAQAGRLVQFDQRSYGDTRLTFYRETDDADGPLSGNV
jgi:16S rRNA (guanine966-N2)-methyltransferase